jgi:hypothetical protein
MVKRIGVSKTGAASMQITFGRSSVRARAHYRLMHTHVHTHMLAWLSTRIRVRPLKAGVRMRVSMGRRANAKACVRVGGATCACAVADGCVWARETPRRF